MKHTKKGNVAVIAVIVVIVAITAGIIGWMFAKKTQLPAPQVAVIQPIEQKAQQNDTILFSRKDGTYSMNILDKKLEPADDNSLDFLTFSGLPKEMKNKTTSVSSYPIIVSKDKTKAIVVSSTINEAAMASEFDGSKPILDAKEFVCDSATQKCIESNILAEAHKASGGSGNWYGYTNPFWYIWDSSTNLLYGHLTGEGVGNASPVYIYNVITKDLQQTIGYDSNGEGRRAEAPNGIFSPSLKKFVMIDENIGIGENGDAKYGKWELLLYSSSDLSKPSKKIDVSEMQKTDSSYNRVGSVAWSLDEKMLVLETNKHIYTLNLDSGEIILRYTDNTEDNSGTWLDTNAIDLSSGDRYIVFVDYDKRDTPYEENKMNPVLKAIDIQDNNKVIELLREEDVSLLYNY